VGGDFGEGSRIAIEGSKAGQGGNSTGVRFGRLFTKIGVQYVPAEALGGSEDFQVDGDWKREILFHKAVKDHVGQGSIEVRVVALKRTPAVFGGHKGIMHVVNGMPDNDHVRGEILYMKEVLNKGML